MSLLFARLSPVLGGTEAWHYLVTLAGAATMLDGAILAFPQTDLKRILAYTTVSTPGALTLLLGLNTTLAAKTAMVFLIVHSLYEGALFMIAGAVDHETGTRDLHELSELRRFMSLTTLMKIWAAAFWKHDEPLPSEEQSLIKGPAHRYRGLLAPVAMLAVLTDDHELASAWPGAQQEARPPATTVNSARQV